MTAVRLLLSLASILGLSTASADVKGAYMQSGPIKRELYVRPPRKISLPSNVWKLTRLLYGIVEAGRQWLCVIENWTLEKYHMPVTHTVDQRFYKKGESGKITIFVAKVVDDFLIVGKPARIDHFVSSLNSCFKLGQISNGSEIKFLGCAISRSPERHIMLSMSYYMSRVVKLNLQSSRASRLNQPASVEETGQYRNLAGTLLYLGQAVLPQACFVAPKMQQRLGSLRVTDLVAANAMVKELQKLRPKIDFPSPVNIKEVIIKTITDASHCGNNYTYGQTALVNGMKIDLDKGSLFHPIFWSSTKQRKICYSSVGSEILAAADGDDRRYSVKMTLMTLFPKCNIKHQLLVDSKSLFETITTKS